MAFASLTYPLQYLSPSGAIGEVRLRSGGSSLEKRLASYAAGCLQRQLRTGCIRVDAQRNLPELTIALPHWEHASANLTGFDRLFEKVAGDGDFRLVLWTRDWLGGVQPALELLNRYQRLLPLPADYRALPRLGEVLTARRLLTTSRSGHDAWRWLLRLGARPSRPLELSALFHDVLLTDDDDARAARRSLACLGFGKAELAAAAELSARSEAGDDTTTELALLRDARDLCFFSNETWHYARRNAPTKTLAQVRLRLGRMTARALCLALATRQPPDVASMMDDVLDEDERAPDSGIRRA